MTMGVPMHVNILCVEMVSSIMEKHVMMEILILEIDVLQTVY